MKVGLQQLDSILDRTYRHPPSKAVLPILAGFSSYNPHIRKKARDKLFTISRQLARLLETNKNPDRLQSIFVESSILSARIYHEIRFNDKLSENEVGIFFNVLAELGSPGRFYAWRIWQERFTVRPYLKSLVEFFPDKLKLAFVEEYLNASLSKRRRHALFFRHLLGNIKSRKAVIDLLADLFCRRKPLDPFWLNLNPALLDTDHLISEELRSGEPANRKNAVTALYMIVEKPGPEILSTLLKEDPAWEVRKAVLDIIGDAPPGSYEPLIPLVLNRLAFMEKEEALAGFKALCSSLSYPPHRAVEVVRTERPNLMPEIFNEISSFSRTAFLFAWDLIENPVYYNEKGQDLFREMVKGLIHRHPKAVLGTALTMGQKRFIKNLNDYILKEEKQFHSWIRQGKNRFEKIKSSAPASKKSFSRFTEARQKANEKKGHHPVHCQNTYFNEIDFSGEIIDSLSYLFDNSSLNRCRICDTRFRKSSFNRTVFHETDLDSAIFRRSSFDDAVFINVRAENTKFIGCSFHRASFYKCSFTGAKLFHSVFSRTRISRTDFSRADIFGSSFTGAGLFKTSFENSRLRETDFSGARAKECKWNPSADTDIRSAYTDFHTGFIPGFKGRIPDFNFNEKVRISQLIGAQFADFGRELFMIKNRNVLLAACDIFPSKSYDIFEMIPLLLHENISFPGHNGIFHNTPHGICWYSPSDRSLETAKKYLGGQAVKEGSEPDIPHIQGLFTIGSTGTLSQNSTSDIDYWVCIEESGFTAGMKNALEEKLEKLESWSQDFFKTEIHFFILDINRLKENDFGKTTPHSSGSAQAKILKDEFYRTMIHVAGRVPLWATLPSSVSSRAYDSIHNALQKLPSRKAYIDLGDVQSISGNEFYGALIWQIFKGIKSSFKSVIKMALVEKYLYNSQDTPLLCNQLKDRWLHSPSYIGILRNDPYHSLVESLINYYEGKQAGQSANLVKLCFVLQMSNLNPSDMQKSVFGIKKNVIQRIVSRNLWNDENVFRIGDLKQWHFNNILKISEILENHFLEKYKELSRTLEQDEGKRNLLTKSDKEILEKKMEVQFSSRPGKVDNIMLVVENEHYFQELYLRYEKESGFWELVHRSGKLGNKKENILKTSSNIEEIAAWMINNLLYTPGTHISLVPNETYVTSNDIKHLFESMYTLFAPYHRNNINLSAYLSHPSIVLMLISVNFYASRTCRGIRDAVAIHINSWGEMFCNPLNTSSGTSSISELESILKEQLQIGSLPANRTYFFPKRFRNLSISW